MGGSGGGDSSGAEGEGGIVRSWREVVWLDRAFIALVGFGSLGLTVISAAVLVAAVFGWEP